MASDPGRPPFYARLLRLQNIRPGVVSCFLFLEGTLVLSGLLALAGLVSPWAVLVLPVSVAAAVKINDIVAGATTAAPAKPASRGSRSERSRSERSRSESSRSTESTWSSGKRSTESRQSHTPTSQDLMSQKLAAERELYDD